jgi:hypothetical protein
VVFLGKRAANPALKNPELKARKMDSSSRFSSLVGSEEEQDGDEQTMSPEHCTLLKKALTVVFKERLEDARKPRSEENGGEEPSEEMSGSGAQKYRDPPENSERATGLSDEPEGHMGYPPDNSGGGLESRGQKTHQGREQTSVANTIQMEWQEQTPDTGGAAVNQARPKSEIEEERVSQPKTIQGLKSIINPKSKYSNVPPNAWTDSGRDIRC